MGFLIEKAGGKSIMNGKTSLLDYEIKGYDDRLYFLYYLVPSQLEAQVKSIS